MAEDVIISSKDLPQLTEIKNGDFIYLETESGTSLLDFENLILPIENTAITTTVQQNTDSIIALSAESLTKINELSSTVTNPSTLYVGKAVLTIPAGNKSYTVTLSPTTTKTLTINDVQITPANEYASRFSFYVKSIEGNSVTVEGRFKVDSVYFKDTPLLTFTSDLTANVLSAVSPTTLSNSLSVTDDGYASLSANLGIVTSYIAAESDAIYNILVLK